MVAYACEMFGYDGKETKSVLLLRWKRDQSKESRKEKGKEAYEKASPETKKAIAGSV
jgi:hypothetical protein